MKKEFFLLAGLVLSAVACQERIQPEEPSRPVLTSPLEGAVNGKILIKVTDELKREFESLTDEEGNVMIAGVKSVDNALADMNVKSVSRLFKSDPRFVKRERESGVDKWYEIVFDENVPLTKAAENILGIEGVEYAEYDYKVRNASEPIYTFATNPPFDDPRSTETYQWHYQNNGTNAGTVAGSDINLYNAYNRYGVYGSPEVIVAIVDGGIQYNHPDLAQNMWINEAELNGQEGVDDDGNGYVDDIYGYNFMYPGAVTPHDHGTHVAGTVGAVNNNGVGVVGVAGGNGSPDSGVRLMSCQIFDSKNEKGSGNSASAIKYGADNGAVIAQNSWGLAKENAYYLPQATQAAIDYFIEYAGKDADGNQVGPMNGGIVIFAAGNDEHHTMASPAFYEKVLAVAAIGADYKLAYYSNVGDWVDITTTDGYNQVVIAGGEPLIGVHRLVLRADVQKAEPVVRRVLVLLHAVVRFREVGVLVRARAVHLQRLVQQAQRGNIILFVQLRLRHVQQGVGAQVEPYLSFIHRILVLCSAAARTGDQLLRLRGGEDVIGVAVVAVYGDLALLGDDGAQLRRAHAGEDPLYIISAAAALICGMKGVKLCRAEVLAPQLLGRARLEKGADGGKAADVLLDEADARLARAGQRLHEHAARAQAGVVRADLHAHGDRRRELFAVREIGGKILADLAADQLGRADEGLPLAVLADDGEIPVPPDAAAHVQLAARVGRQIDLRLFDIAAHMQRLVAADIDIAARPAPLDGDGEGAALLLQGGTHIRRRRQRAAERRRADGRQTVDADGFVDQLRRVRDGERDLSPADQAAQHRILSLRRILSLLCILSLHLATSLYARTHR